VAHRRVAEAAVVSKPHDIKGESVFAYVVLRGARPQGAVAAALIEELRNWVGEQLSPIAKPDEIRFSDNLPKTRSGKIMRRLLRALARGEEITQDMSTLENPGILDQLRGDAAAAPKKPAARAKANQTATRPKAERAAARPKAKQIARRKAKRAATLPKIKRAARVKAKRSAQPKAKPAAARTRRAKTAINPKAAAKRAKRSARVKRAKRKVVTTKSRRAAVKAVRRKPRSKK